MTLEIAIVIGMFIVAGAMIWRPYRRRRSVEDVLEGEAVARDHERHRDRAIVTVDRYTRPPDFPG